MSITIHRLKVSDSGSYDCALNLKSHVVNVVHTLQIEGDHLVHPHHLAPVSPGDVCSATEDQQPAPPQRVDHRAQRVQSSSWVSSKWSASPLYILEQEGDKYYHMITIIITIIIIIIIVIKKFWLLTFLQHNGLSAVLSTYPFTFPDIYFHLFPSTPTNSIYLIHFPVLSPL